MSVLLRELEPADLPAVVALNDDAVPAVPMTDEDEMALLTAIDACVLCAAICVPMFRT